MKNCIRLKSCSLVAVLAALFFSLTAPRNVSAQTYSDSMFTGSLKYNLLEVAMGTWAGYGPDAVQDVYEKILPLYPRTVVAFWHSGDVMSLPGTPYQTELGVSAYPHGTIDRTLFGSTMVYNRPYDSLVGVRNALTPKFNVKLVCSYNTATSTLTVKVTGTALTTLTGNWNINAYVLQDSISTGISTAYRQVNYYNAAGSTSCTGSPSWYIGMGNPISSGTSYSHMNVARAILAPGADIWGEAAFTNPTTGTVVTKTYSYVVPLAYAHHLKVVGLVEKFGTVTTDRSVENVAQVKLAFPLQLFAWTTSSVSRSVCEGTTASIDSFLDVEDEIAGHPVNWSLAVAPLHGTAIATYSLPSTGGTLHTLGMGYTPTPGYTGLDSFKVAVTNGTRHDTITLRYTVNPSPSAFTGTTPVCLGDVTTLGSTPTGGTWASGTPGVATIGSSSGVVTTVAVGTTTITYTAPVTGCMRTGVVAVISSIAPVVSGASSVCQGASTTLTGTPVGGTWLSDVTTVATIGSSSGIVTGVAAGTTIITYILSATCAVGVTMYPFTVNPAPTVPTGATTICVGSTATLSSTPSGGTWSSSDGGVATIASGTGIVTGFTTGTTNITYTAGGCSASTTLTVDTTPSAGIISGLAVVCQSNSITLANSVAGGTWSSSVAAAATVDATTGIVTGVASGVTMISYTVTNLCGTATATVPVTVNPLPAAGTVSGPATVCEGSTITLSATATGGAWTSANSSATVSATGVVTGVTAGTTTISYTLTNSCGSSSATTDVEIVPLFNCATAVSAPAYPQGVAVYPNPATDELHIDLNNASHLNGAAAEVRIFNSLGALVSKHVLGNGANTISLQKLPRGVFVAEILCPDGEKLVHKIVTQ